MRAGSVERSVHHNRFVQSRCYLSHLLLSLIGIQITALHSGLHMLTTLRLAL